MMLAGVPVSAEAVAELADTVKATAADELADRLEVALADGVALLALTIDERAIILGQFEDPPDGLAASLAREASVRDASSSSELPTPRNRREEGGAGNVQQPGSTQAHQ